MNSVGGENDDNLKNLMPSRSKFYFKWAFIGLFKILIAIVMDSFDF
jgi:hypothetical protein